MQKYQLKKLTSFGLAMIVVAFVTSIRGLPMMAEYGFSCMFYYLLAIIMFLIPSALVCAELATAWPDRGGVYIWVKQAFNGPWGFLAIWIQFIVNIINIPTLLSFTAATAAYIFMPQLAQNKYYILSFILAVFWGSTLISFWGIKSSSYVNTFGFLIGILIPVIFIITLGTIWLLLGYHSQISFSTQTFFPNFTKINLADIVFVSSMFFTLMGIETSAAHALDLKNIQKDYPCGIFISVFFITFIGMGALAIAAVVPKETLNIMIGDMQAFSTFFSKFNMSWATPVLALVMVVGIIGTVNSNVIGPSKGLFGAAIGGEIPQFLTKTNNQGVPVNMFIVQSTVVSLISLLFVFMPTISSSYWLILVVATILYLFMYLLLFIAAIVLRYKYPDTPRAYRVPGGMFGIWLVSGLGIISTIFCLIISFIPPTQLQLKSKTNFELLLVAGITIFIGIGLIIYRLRRKVVSDSVCRP
jgi:glutamate:GABA antiporter